MCFNNLSNALIERLSNEIYYKFKIRETIYVIIKINKNKNRDKKVKTQLNNFEVIQFRY